MLTKNRESIKKARKSLEGLFEKNINLYIDLFFYEKVVGLEDYISKSLLEAGIIHKAGNKWQANVMVFPFRGKFIVTDFLLSYQRMKNGKFLRGIDDVWVMFPHETLLFIEELENVHSKLALDIASGSGAISLFLADRFEKVYSVDINPKAVGYSKFNTILNDLDHKIINIQSDLFRNVPKIKFDYICWNGPTVALPEVNNAEKVYPLYTYGGYDGAAFTKKFLDQVFSFTNTSTTIKWWDGSMGNKKHSTVDLYMQQKLSSIPLDIEIEYLNARGGVPLREYDEMYLKYCSNKFELNQDEKLRQKAAKQWYKKLKENSFDYVYISLITIKSGEQFHISREYPKRTRVSAKHVYGFEWHFTSRNYIKKYLLEKHTI